MAPVELFLSRLERSIPSGKNRWVACCPAHDDRDPSLSITEAQDGRVLVHCFAGCSAMAVVEALGLSLGDLFPPEIQGLQVSHKPVIRDRKTAETVDHWVLEIAKSTRAQGKKLSQQDLQREREAFMRLAPQAKTA